MNLPSTTDNAPEPLAAETRRAVFAAALEAYVAGKRQKPLPPQTVGAMPAGKRLATFKSASLLILTRYARRNPKSDVAPALALWLLALADNEKGCSWVSLSRLGRVLNRGQKAMGAALSKLVEAGGFACEGNDGGAGNTGRAKRIWPLLSAFMTEASAVQIMDAFDPPQRGKPGPKPRAMNGDTPGEHAGGNSHQTPGVHDGGNSITPGDIDEGNSRDTPGEDGNYPRRCRQLPPSSTPTDLPKLSSLIATSSGDAAGDEGEATSREAGSRQPNSNELFNESDAPHGIQVGKREWRWRCPKSYQPQKMSFRYVEDVVGADEPDKAIVRRFAEEELAAALEQGFDGPLVGYLRHAYAKRFLDWKRSRQEMLLKQRELSRRPPGDRPVRG